MRNDVYKKTSETVCEIWGLISQKNKVLAVVLMPLAVVTGLLELASIALVAPTINMLITGNDINIDQYVIEASGLDILVSVLLITIALGAFLRITIIKYETRLAHVIGADLGDKCFKNLLDMNYEKFRVIESNSFISTISVKISNAIYQTILPIMNTSSSIVLGLIIAIGLLVIFPVQTLITLFVLSAIYKILTLFYKTKINKKSNIVSGANTKLIKVIQHYCFSFKDTFLNKKASEFFERFHTVNTELRDSQSDIQIYAAIPRYVIENAGLIALILLARYYSYDGIGVNGLSSVAVIGFGLQKLLPITQQIYRSYVTIKGDQASMEDVVQLTRSTTDPVRDFVLRGEFTRLQLVDVAYNHDKKAHGLKKINITIGRGEKHVLMGHSGSGKTTLIDLLMGLITPKEGQYFINNLKINDSGPKYNLGSLMSHAPQNVYIFTGTVKYNIIGKDGSLSKDEDSRLKVALWASCMDEFVDKMALGLETILSENGSNLSGGQRQRIGIARALYQNASITIFDESTNALDVKTEDKIFQRITSSFQDRSFVFVMHRLPSENFIDFKHVIVNGELHGIS